MIQVRVAVPDILFLSSLDAVRLEFKLTSDLSRVVRREAIETDLRAELRVRIGDTNLDVMPLSILPAIVVFRDLELSRSYIDLGVRSKIYLELAVNTLDSIRPGFGRLFHRSSLSFCDGFVRRCFLIPV